MDAINTIRQFRKSFSLLFSFFMLMLLLSNLFHIAPSDPDENNKNTNTKPFTFTDVMVQVMGESSRNTLTSTERLENVRPNNWFFDIWLEGQFIKDIFYAVFYKSLLFSLVWATFLSIIVLWQKSQDGKKSVIAVI